MDVVTAWRGSPQDPGGERRTRGADFEVRAADPVEARVRAKSGDLAKPAALAAPDGRGGF